MKEFVLKKIALFFLIFTISFFIVACEKKDNEPSEEEEFVYFENIYGFEECYLYDGSSEYPGLKMTKYGDSEKIYMASIKNNSLIIFNDGTNQLPEVTFNKDLPYYLNGWKNIDELANEHHYVYFSLSYGFSKPLLCYLEEGNLVQDEMVYLNSDLYLGLLKEGISSYYYEDMEKGIKTDELTYSNEFNHYFYDHLVSYDQNNKLSISEVPSNTYRAYFIKPDLWEECQIYFWNNSGEYQKWPGVEANYLGAGVYYYNIPLEYPNFIFNCGNNTTGITIKQTADLTLSGDYQYPCYNLTTSSFEELFLIKALSKSVTTIYLDKPHNWSMIYISSPLNNKQMSLLEDDIYYCEIPSDTKELIFSNGSTQFLIPLAFDNNNPYFHNGSWTVYETKPDSEIINPDKAESLTYEELFDPNSKITIEIQITPEELLKIENDYQRFSKMGSKSPIYRMCNLKITINSDVYYYPEVGIRMKGNTSRTSFYSENKGIYQLIHFKLSFDETFDDVDEYTSDEIINWDSDLRKIRKDRTFATLSSLDLKWNKNLDTTYIKSIYATQLYQEAGILAPNTTLSQVQITQFNNLENLGVFQLIENVDNNFLEKHLNSSDLGGDLYKIGWDNQMGGTLAINSLYGIGIEDEFNSYFPIYDLKTNKKTSTHENLINLIQTLDSNTSVVANLVDMDYFIKFSAISYLVGNPDDYRNNYNNYYLYFLKSSNKAIFIPYDLDRVFGITKDWDPSGNAMTNIDPFSTNSVSGKQLNPIVLEMLKNNSYLTSYTACLKSYLTNSFFTTISFNNLFNTYRNNYRTVVKPSLELNNSYVVFSLSDSLNMTFDNYLNAIVKNLRNI